MNARTHALSVLRSAGAVDGVASAICRLYAGGIVHRRPGGIAPRSGSPALARSSPSKRVSADIGVMLQALSASASPRSVELTASREGARGRGARPGARAEEARARRANLVRRRGSLDGQFEPPSSSGGVDGAEL